MGLTPMFIADEEDGPAVAVLFDLPNGDQVWSGEVSRALFGEQSPEDQTELGSDRGAFVIFAEKGGDTTILAKATDPSTAMDLATAYAAWRVGQKGTAPADGALEAPSTLGTGGHIDLPTSPTTEAGENNP